MSREIKFRAWIKRSWDSGSQKWAKNKMLYNAYPYLYTKVCLPDSGIGFANEGEFELMQYTGLKDKNRKEIYEGDIMECFLGDELDRVEIYFSSEFAIFDFKPRDSDDTLSDLIFFGYTVIGNIYENPELL